MIPLAKSNPHTKLSFEKAASYISSILKSDPHRWRCLGIVGALGLPDCWIGAGFLRNQEQMHIRNGDQPYSSALDAMRYWPETATAVATRRMASHLAKAKAF